MKNYTNSTWLQKAGMLLTAGALTYTAIGIEASSAFAQPAATEIAAKTTPKGSDVIADAISNLQQSKKRWIEVNLSTQRLIAWEGKKPVHAVIVSTGKASTPTRTGVYAVETKLRSARMQGDDYDVPDVPYTMYYSGGYAIHGAYWHNRFGTPVSHGCVNVAVDHAERLFSWASVGTPIVVHR
jgi:lipoprotein-anchoring transpeptidase ErfK/SrfK